MDRTSAIRDCWNGMTLLLSGGRALPAPKFPRKRLFLILSTKAPWQQGQGRGWEGKGKGRGGEQQIGLSAWVERGEVKVKSLSHVRLFATPWTI